MSDETQPPRDFPPDDWAVTRSVGDLCRYDGRIWRWDGQDWYAVAGPNLTVLQPRGGTR